MAVESSCVTLVCVLRLQYGQSMYAGCSRSRSKGVTLNGFPIGTILEGPPNTALCRVIPWIFSLNPCQRCPSYFNLKPKHLGGAVGVLRIRELYEMCLWDSLRLCMIVYLQSGRLSLLLVGCFGRRGIRQRFRIGFYRLWIYRPVGNGCHVESKDFRDSRLSTGHT